MKMKNGTFVKFNKILKYIVNKKKSLGFISGGVEMVGMVKGHGMRRGRLSFTVWDSSSQG